MDINLDFLRNLFTKPFIINLDCKLIYGLLVYATEIINQMKQMNVQLANEVRNVMIVHQIHAMNEWKNKIIIKKNVRCANEKKKL